MPPALLVVLAACAPAARTGATPPAPLRVMTYNIRYANPGDGIDAWTRRKDRVAAVIRDHGADLAGLQEALKGQIDHLTDRLTDLAWFGVGRDDGREAGEFSPIFFRRGRLERLDGENFWLSETPERPGPGWDAQITRIATWAKFRDRATGRTFFHFNTHFDHRGERARAESARLLRSRISALAGPSSVIVTGDLNSRDDAPPYRILTAADGPEPRLRDARTVSERPHEGPRGTLSGFVVSGEVTNRIDYILVGPGVRVLRHATLDDSQAGRYPSDHLAVWAEVCLE